MSSMKDDYTDSHDFCGKSSLVFVITNKLCWKTKAAFWQLGVKSMSDTGVGLPSGQNRCPVVSNAALHNALTLMIQPPPSHLGLQDSKHQLLERIPPPHPYTHTHTPNCNMGQACLRSRWLVHIISSTGQFPRMIIACNTHPGRGGLACARICCANLPPLEVRRPRGQG